MNVLLKRQISILAFSSLLFITAATAQDERLMSPANLLPNALEQQKHQTPSLPANTSEQWYQQATEYITASEYFFQPFGTEGQYSAANHAQHLGFLFSGGGYTVKNFTEKANSNEASWEARFAIQGIGRKGHIAALPKTYQQNYTNESLAFNYGNTSIEYLNTKEGMRQNFYVHTKPAGIGPLQVIISLAGDLQPSVTSSNQLLMYSKENRQSVKLTYDKLKVWDARNKPLTATMTLLNNNQLVISVDDKEAVYPVTIDPLNHTPAWTDNGQGLLFPLLDDLSLHVLYGFSVSSAGDVNGDTYADLIIGVPAYVKIISIAGNSFSPVSVGAAFIYYGGPGGASANPNEVLQPSLLTGALSGFSVSSAGDVNNDGKADVLVSAPGDNISLTVLASSVSVAVGKVYVYSGASFDGSVNTQPAPVAGLSMGQSDFGPLAMVPANPLFGFSISSAGDVNGDGFGDILVGSPAYLDLLSLTLGGRVDIYHGSASGIVTTPARTIKGGLLNGLFGYSVNTAGKVNNDAYSDIIVGSPASISILGVGAAFVFHGSATGITATTAAGANTTLQAPGLLNKTLFGYSVSTAGDVNGDGKDDVIVGEPLSLETTLSLQLVAVGKAHIFYGSNSGIVSSGATQLTSPRSPNLLGLIQGNLLFGFSVAAAGDMNCDGMADVIVGEPGGSAISLGTGALGLVSANALSGNAYVFAGKSGTGPANLPIVTVQETGPLSVANLLGASVRSAGDVNGDGHPDILVGAPNGTLDLASTITGIVGSALGYVANNSVGSAYVWYGCNFALLPVKLLSFDVAKQGEGAVLNWTVTGSDKNSRYEIERSTNGISFTTIGSVNAAPGAGSEEHYSFTDKLLPAQKNYYRLKITDDNKASYSKVVLITAGANAQQLRVSPNPARETIQLNFNNMPAGRYSLMMINSSGQLTFKKDINLMNSVYEMQTIERSPSMTAGTYFIRLVNQNSQAVNTSKIILE